ncbi:hypothetical protein BV898_07394 [Hypsibius exemplaris]|uniref:Transmembrane protein 138 n=1 Tax=Hypsibius exemplaris TaxID=2072580 RepID=A0A1W0WTN0_HYPEX|nr:hypothetical protein BV898_07394 [Hypsibius exemplaris]
MLFDTGLILTFLQVTLLVADVVFNVIVGLFLTAPQAQIAIYIIQDLCLLLAAGTLCVHIFSSWFCLSGFLRPVFVRFWSTAVAWLIYFGLTLGIHVWAITQCYIYYYLMYRKAMESRKMEAGRRANRERNLTLAQETLRQTTISKDNPPLSYSKFPDSSPDAPRLRI